MRGTGHTCGYLYQWKKAGSTDNMHRTWKLDVKGFLHSGENQIRIVFRSVFKYIEDYEYEENKEIHYVPCGGMKGNQLIRKAHCMFGWDWGPQTIDAGIFRDIYLEAYSHPRIEDVKITQRHGDNAVDVCTTVAVSGDAVDKCQVRVSIRKDMTSVCGNGHAVQETGDLEIYADGAVLLNSNSVTLTGRIHNPKLWWPNGYGDQPLYKVKVELLDEDGEVLETITKRIGLRTLTISQEKDLWGKEFAFCVNGVKILPWAEIIFRRTVFIPGSRRSFRSTFWNPVNVPILTASVCGVAVIILRIISMISVTRWG